jgi:hypothetical protein
MTSLMVILPCCVALSLRPPQDERSSPDAHEPGRERAAVADLRDAARASPSRLAGVAEAAAPPTVLLSRTLIAAATAISAAMLQATKLLFLAAAEGSSRTPAGRRRALLGDLGWAPG